MNYHNMKNRYIYLLSAVAVLSWSACGKKNKKNAAMPPTPVSEVEAKSGETIYYDNYQSSVVALNSVELRAQVAGFIKSLHGTKPANAKEKQGELFQETPSATDANKTDSSGTEKKVASKTQ